jgi:hypothetical protein
LKPKQLAAYHGRRVNLSALARSCGLCYQTARKHLLALENTGVLRLLRPLGPGGQKRAAPVLYLRDLRLLGLLAAQQLYRTRLVEAVATRVAGAATAGRVGYLPRPHGGIVEPVVEVPTAAGPALVGFAFCADPLPRRRSWATLSRVQRLGLLRQGFVLYQGNRAFFSAARVAVVPDAAFLGEYAEWMAAALDLSPKALQQLMRRCNDRAAAAVQASSGGRPPPGAGLLRGQVDTRAARRIVCPPCTGSL